MKLVFYGLDAYVRSHSGRRIYFSPENPNRDPNMYVPVDLDKTPAAAQAGKIPWGEVVVDDVGDANLKLTTVNPWDSGGRRRGGVWVEERQLNLLRRLFPLPLPDPRSPHEKLHELMSVRYYAEDPSGDRRRVGRRYLGYHAQVIDPGASRVRVWHAGTSGDPHPHSGPVELAVNFDDPEQVDYPTSKHGLTEIGVAPGMPSEGALFLDDGFATTHALRGNKKPPEEGL